MRRTISFVVNFPSIHMVFLYEHLSKYYNVNVISYSDLPKTRESEGWSSINSKNINFYTLDNIPEEKGIVVLCGIQAIKLVSFFSSVNNNYIYLAEPPIYYNRLQKYSKLLYYKLIKFIYLRNKKVFCFGIGTDSIFYKHIFNNFNYLMYFVNQKKPKYIKKIKTWIYIGSLSKRKNIVNYFDLFVENKKILDIYSADSYNSESKYINHCGSVHNDNILEVLKQYKYLILPSLADGWGMVVSEALSVNCNVVVSDKVGSRYLNKFFSNEFYYITDIKNLLKLNSMSTTNPVSCNYTKLLGVQLKHVQTFRLKIDELYNK